jgi:hypothetical protein
MCILSENLNIIGKKHFILTPNRTMHFYVTFLRDPYTLPCSYCAIILSTLTQYRGTLSLSRQLPNDSTTTTTTTKLVKLPTKLSLYL